MAHPPTPVTVTAAQIQGLDLSPLAEITALSLPELLPLGGQLELTLRWPTAPEDPRELSEIPEVRLWCLRADAECPWLPLLLERSSGTLARHVAMLLPHRFSRNEGLQFAPDSLELWISHRLFQLDALARGAGLECRQGLGQMAAVLGYELDPGFWAFAPRG
ncbi:MAG: CRR6 family NdhI maturation factor [Cyanobacteriota bacterium]|nr:CRR6 family NdhI maturation factor [Cyanobacteriota bacterium]